MKKIAIFLAFFLMSLPSVMAIQPTQQYNQIFLNPFVLPAMTNNNNYSFIVNVNPPDGISSVKSAIISFDVYMTPSVNFTVWVNGSLCNTQFFYISTTFSGAGQGRIKFDCSNRITKAGTYNVTLRPSGANIGSINGWLDLTYMNNPLGSFKAYGTEYQIGQNGTLFIKLLDNNELPINTGFCSITAYYPNKTIKFMDNSPTTFLENGLYYKDFFVPNTEGLYIAYANCVYNDNVYRYVPSEDCRYDGNIAGGTSPQPLTFSEVDCVGFQTTAGGTYQNFTYNYTSIGLINLSAISQIDVNWVGQVGAANVNIQIYDWNASVWDSLGTSLASTGITLSCGNNVYITRVRSQNFTSYVRNNTVKVRIFRSGSAAMITDSMEIIFHNNGSVVASLKGSSEIHVNNFFNGSVNLSVNLNSTQLGSILSAIASVNQTLNTTIVNYLVQINGTVFNINGTEYNSLLSAINSVNATSNQSISLLNSLNLSVFNLGINETSHFNQLLALLNEINYTLNTTIVNYLSYINGTTFQTNQSQTAYYLSLLGSLEALNTTLNGSITQYLVAINGTTYNLSVNEFNHYISVLQSTNSINDSINNTVIPLLLQINATGNTTLTFVASINQSLLNYYLDLRSFLESINVSINTTMEYKLDLINQTVFQINDSLSALNVTVNLTGLYDALASINETINSTVLNMIITTNNNVLNHNTSEYQHFLAMSVLLNNINYGINTTLENKLDYINATTWQTLLLLQNLTIGNVSVMADVNWTEGYKNLTFLSFSDKIGGEGITLTSETLICSSNTTLQHLINATQCSQGYCWTGNSTITETCLHGCANNMCIPAPQIQFASAIIFALLIIGGIVLTWKAAK